MRTNDEKTTIGLVQINNSFSGQSYLPYSVGMLQAYALKHMQNADRYHFLLPLYRRIPVDEAVDQLKAAKVVCFSLYVWNIRVSLEIAKRLKARWPEIITVTTLRVAILGRPA